MAKPDDEIMEFRMLVSRLLGEYVKMKDELADVKAMLENQKKEIQEMELLASAAMHDYDMLKTARMLEVGDGDVEAARKRVNKLIRDVNKCITLLSEQDNG